MSGLTGKRNSTLKKELVKESKLLATGVKSIKFWHEATAGETSIPFGSLTMPSDVAANGLTNPSSTEILAANLAIFHTNVEVKSSLNGVLMEGLIYVVQNAQIKFVNGYTVTAGEIFEVSYKNDTITGTNVVDARPLTATGVLTAGNTDFNVGEAFKTNQYPLSQIGEVLVFVDGEIQFRNTANATAAPAADGNYQEVHATGGFGTIIRFNNTFAVDKNIVVISRNLIAERPDISMMQLIENLGGQLDAVISTTAALAGVPETDFQANPNQVDLRAFGDAVTQNTKDILAKQDLVHHSTTEQDTGVEWIDGRKIYRRSFDLTVTVTSTVVTTLTTIATALEIIDLECTGYDSTQNKWVKVSGNGGGGNIGYIQYDDTTGIINMRIDGWTFGREMLVVHYLK